MAKSGYIEYVYPIDVSAQVFDTPRLKLSWEIVSSSREDNTTTIQYKYEFYAPSQKRATTKNRIVINGVIIGVLPKERYLFPKGWTTLEEGTLTIKHEKDGTKTFDYSFEETYDAIKPSASGTGTLEPINRAPDITFAAHFTDYSNPGFVYRNIAGNDIDTLEACIADSKGNVIVDYRAISKKAPIAATYEFDLTIAERDDLRIAATGSILDVRFQIRYTIGSKSGIVYLNSVMTLTNYAPILAPTLVETDTEILALTGGNAFILDYSDVRATVNATVKPGSASEIISQSVRNGTQSSSSGTAAFTNISTNVFEFSAMDNKGKMTVEKITAELVPYVPITCRQTARIDLKGTLVLTIEGNYFNGSFGAVNNQLTVETRHRESGGNWSAWEDMTVLAEASGDTYYVNASISNYNPSATYEFQSRASDKLMTVVKGLAAESNIETVVLKPIFDWGKYDFNFNVPITIEGYELNDYVVETGTATMGTNGIWHWRKWKSGRAECYGCCNYGNMAITTTWGGLYRSESFSQSLPTGLFADTPEVIDITYRGANYGGWIARHEAYAASDSETGGFIVVRPASATLTAVPISFNVIGRWK